MMKKSILILLSVFAIASLNAQSLEEIVKKQAQALKEEKYNDVKTLKITGRTSQMGMDLITNIYYKSPNKSKTVISFNGQEIIQVFDGEKGYMISPMMGSTEPQELPVEQAESMKKQSQFKSPLSSYFVEGKLTLEGTENVKDRPAFKIKVNDPANTIYMFIDKATYLPVKTAGTSGGVNIDTYMDWGEISGIMLPKVTTMSANGTEVVIYIESAEVNIPIEDSFFKVK